MADDIERLRAALDKAERLAIGAGRDGWYADPDDGDILERSDHTHVARPRKSYYTDHIVAWGPDVVLRLVERDRALISDRLEAHIRFNTYGQGLNLGRADALGDQLVAALAFWCPEPSPEVPGG